MKVLLQFNIYKSCSSYILIIGNYAVVKNHKINEDYFVVFANGIFYQG